MGPELEKQGHGIHMFLADGKNPEFTNEEVSRAVQESDFVLLAVSNRLQETLFAGREANAYSIPFGIYAASGPDHYFAENLEPLREGAELLFVFSEEEVLGARKLFPKAKVVVSGSPSWEKFFFPEITREEARKQLVAREGETLVLITGDTDLILNILLFALTIEAVGLLGRRIRVILGMHPGDPNPISSYTGLARCVPKNVSVSFVSREAKEGVPEDMDFRVLPTPRVLPGMDLVVTFTSTLGLEAACQRIPVICFFPGYGLVQVRKEWEQCRNKTAIAVYGSSPKELAEELDRILVPNSDLRNKLIQRQKQVYSKPPLKGSATGIVIETLNALRA